MGDGTAIWGTGVSPSIFASLRVDLTSRERCQLVGRGRLSKEVVGESEGGRVVDIDQINGKDILERLGRGHSRKRKELQNQRR